jgi:hypothetical protein
MTLEAPMKAPDYKLIIDLICVMLMLTTFIVFTIFARKILKRANRKFEPYMLATLIFLGLSCVVLLLHQLAKILLPNQDPADKTLSLRFLINRTVQQSLEKVAIYIDLVRLFSLIAKLKGSMPVKKRRFLMKLSLTCAILFQIIWIACYAVVFYSSEQSVGVKIMESIQLIVNPLIITAYVIIYTKLKKH